MNLTNAVELDTFFGSTGRAFTVNSSTAIGTNTVPSWADVGIGVGLPFDKGSNITPLDSTLWKPIITGPKIHLTLEQKQQYLEAVKNHKEKPLELVPKEEPKTSPTKHDQGKTNWSLMPFEALEEINKVLEFGAIKYAEHNWQLGSGFKYTRVINSLLRHVFAFMRGEDNDPESGLSHIAHAGCNIVFLLHYIKNKKRYSNDNRFTA